MPSTLPCRADGRPRWPDRRAVGSAGLRLPDMVVAVRILVIGSGAREHALLRALRRDPAVTDLFVAPGNAGTGALATAHPVDVARCSRDRRPFRSARCRSGGGRAGSPTGQRRGRRRTRARHRGFRSDAAAARIEGSKAFAKDVMMAAGVPTAAAVPVGSADARSTAALDRCGSPYVVKDDGLAAGKGVVVTSDREAAVAHALAVLDGGHPVLVEEFLAGPEVSLFAVCDGKRAVPLLPAQDFKRLGDGDEGPNTGGMGAYAPLDWAPADLVAQVQREVLDPVLAEMAARGCPFSGLLYAGLVLTSAGPEGHRVQLPVRRPGDPGGPGTAGFPARWAARRRGRGRPANWCRHRPGSPGRRSRSSIAAEGYPVQPVTGDLIIGSRGRRHPARRHEARRRRTGALIRRPSAVRDSGRTGPGFGAQSAAYALVDVIAMRGAQYRTDIAASAAAGLVRPPARDPS